MFRGRPGSPLRVCGYLGDAEKAACAADLEHLAAVFDAAGFAAYDGAMLSQVSALMAAAPGGRWRKAVRSAFARALPVELEGGIGRYAFTLMPQWAKARWTGGELQPAKLYHFAHAGLLE
ncbi:MAG: hypothetical protein IJ111_14630 [Eggerthellaceae bacterium]|nr:hypothetical protein [Eggerthellaceae bacterium]